MSMNKRPSSFRWPGVNLGAALLIAVIALCVVGLIPGRGDPDAPVSPVDGSGSLVLSGSCQVIQHLTYLPCGHELTRREALPAALVGKRRPELEAAYADWRVTSFAADEVQMSQQLAMYCPQHIVLRADESGMLCVWQNTRGDALTLSKELGIPLS